MSGRTRSSRSSPVSGSRSSTMSTACGCIAARRSRRSPRPAPTAGRSRAASESTPGVPKTRNCSDQASRLWIPSRLPPCRTRRPGRRAAKEQVVSDVNVTVVSAAQRAEQSVTTGTKAWELFRDRDADGSAEIIAARVNGELRDLAHELSDGDVVEGVAIDSDDGRAILRHSTAHVLAQAVQALFPKARLGIGPPVEDGFYYDFDVDTPFVPEDLERLETQMRKIVKEGQSFSRRAVSDDDARAELADEPYKLELIGLKGADASQAADGAGAEVGGSELTVYDNRRRDRSLAWKDLCR